MWGGCRGLVGYCIAVCIRDAMQVENESNIKCNGVICQCTYMHCLSGDTMYVLFLHTENQTISVTQL